MTHIVKLTCLAFRAGNKGFAYTLISPDQERYAGDLIRALETSNVTVPESLRTMWLRYQAKQAAVSNKKIFYNLLIIFILLNRP